MSAPTLAEMAAALEPFAQYVALNYGHLRAARAILARYRAAPQPDADEWQDIATAPRDGTPILVVDTLAPAPGAMLAHWGKHKSHGPDHAWLVGFRDEWHATMARFDAWIDAPTHWMPLPTPPERP